MEPGHLAELLFLRRSIGQAPDIQWTGASLRGASAGFAKLSGSYEEEEGEFDRPRQFTETPRISDALCRYWRALAKTSDRSGDAASYLTHTG